jgi:hypothetical protein
MTKRPEEEKEHKGRSAPPPERERSYQGYARAQEEGVVRDEQAPEEEAPGRARQEEAAGGDREIG